jgi:hypothetical protein
MKTKTLALFLALAALPALSQPATRIEVPTFNRSLCPTNYLPIAYSTNGYAPVTLLSVHVANVSATDCWVLFLNSRTNLTDGTTNYLPFQADKTVAAPMLVFAGLTADISWPAGLAFTNGLTIAASSTPYTFTNTSAAYSNNLIIDATFYGKNILQR